MSKSGANRFIAVAEQYAKRPIMGSLPPTILYELSAPSTPDEARKEVEALVVDGEAMTVA